MTPTDEAAEHARTAFQRILEAEATRRKGWEDRAAAIMAMADAGMSHRKIAAALRVQAEEAGLTADQIEDLGISEGNVHTVIRTEKAARAGRTTK